jgi:hypothetical protein
MGTGDTGHTGYVGATGSTSSTGATGSTRKGFINGTSYGNILYWDGTTYTLTNENVAIAKNIYTKNDGDNFQTISIGCNVGSLYSNNAIAIGVNAGNLNQVSNSIILNASTSSVNSFYSGCYISPIRTSTQTNNILVYDSSTKEITYTNSYVGSTGYTGRAGSTGCTGVMGSTGNTGCTGIQGNTGCTGAQGIQGIQGEQGAKGEKGDDGSKEDKGDTGDKGEKGDQGPAGDSSAATAAAIASAASAAAAAASATTASSAASASAATSASSALSAAEAEAALELINPKVQFQTASVGSQYTRFTLCDLQINDGAGNKATIFQSGNISVKNITAVDANVDDIPTTGNITTQIIDCNDIVLKNNGDIYFNEGQYF